MISHCHFFSKNHGISSRCFCRKASSSASRPMNSAETVSSSYPYSSRTNSKISRACALLIVPFG